MTWVNKQRAAAAALVMVATTVGLWTSLDPWAKIGWKTPDGHQEDIVALEEEIEAQIENTRVGLQIFRDEWTCHGWFKELTELYAKTDAGNSSQRLRDQITALRLKMDSRKCERFGLY